MATARGSIWQNKSKKSGFGKSRGAYGYSKGNEPQIKDGDRYFILTSLRSGKTRVYESPQAAMRDGWYIVQHGK